MSLWRRRWPWGLAVALAALGVGLLLLRPDTPPPKPREDARATPLRRVAVSTSGTAAARDARWQVTLAQLDLQPPAAGQPDDCAAAASPRAKASAPAADDDANAQPAAVARVVARLRDSADPLERAASLLVGDINAWDAARWQHQRDEVARAAQLSTDPRLYELALRACDRLRVDVPDPQDACSGLSRARLLQLDPDNAAVWVRQLADADGRHDDAAAAEALYQASVASRYRSWEPSAARVVSDAMRDEPPQDRYQVLKALGDTRSLMTQGLFIVPLVHQCSKERVADANRRQVCERVAQVLLERSNSPDSTLLGLAVGWQLGRSEEDMAHYVERNELLLDARLAMPPAAKVDCRGASAWTRVLQASVDDADPWSAMQTALAQSGWSAERLKREAEAQKAAQAASQPAPGEAGAPAMSLARRRGRVEIIGARF